MIEQKKEMQIRRAILKLEKEKELWPPSYLGDSEHQSSIDGIETETRIFHIKILVGIPSDYRSGGHIVYIVTDHKTSIRYKVRHYFPNASFDNTYGWDFGVESDVEVEEE